MGQNGFADPSAVEGGGLPQDVPVGEDTHPVGRVSHIEVEDVGPVRQAEVDDLIGLAGRVHQDIIHRVGVAQVLVDDEGVLQDLQTQGVAPVGQPVQIPHGGEGGQNVVDVGLGHPDPLRQLRYPQDRLLDGEAGEDLQGLCQRLHFWF